MDNKSTVNANISRLLIGLLFPSMSAAECVIQDVSTTKNNVVILERTPIRRDVVSVSTTQKKCMVDFRVRIGTSWHSAFGEYSWSGDRAESQACALAVEQAESSVRDRVGKSHVFSERTLICKDRPELRELSQSTIGTVGDQGQFKLHPNYPEKFYHNGAVCRWFTEPQFTGNNIRNFQGVICEVNNAKWVVVDKF